MREIKKCNFKQDWITGKDKCVICNAPVEGEYLDCDGEDNCIKYQTYKMLMEILK